MNKLSYKFSILWPQLGSATILMPHTQQCYEIKLQTFKLCYMQNLFLNYIICHLKIKELSNYVRFFLHMKAYFKENNYSPVYAVNKDLNVSKSQITIPSTTC